MNNPDERLDDILARWRAPDSSADLADRVMEELRQPPPVDCERVESQAHAFVAEELSPPEAGAIHQHVAECAQCDALVGESRRLAEVVHGWQAPDPAPDLVERVRSNLEARRRTEASRRRFPGGSMQMPRLLAALLIVAACLSVANWWRNLGEDEVLPREPVVGVAPPAVPTHGPTLRTMSLLHREAGRFDVAASFGSEFVPYRGHLLRQARRSTR